MMMSSVGTAANRKTAGSDAVISPDGKYRYKLGRYWNPSEASAIWIMLNPSTADNVEDDPTIRRCVSFATRWGFGGIEVYNLFALRSQKPAAIENASDPVGPLNDGWLAKAAKSRRTVIAAWGSCGTRLQSARADEVMRILAQCGCALPAHLGLTKTGQPRHPLYVRGNAKLLSLPNYTSWVQDSFQGPGSGAGALRD